MLRKMPEQLTYFKMVDFQTLKTEYMSGLNLRELGEQHNLDKSTIRWKLYSNGFTDFRKGHKGISTFLGKKHTEETKQKLRLSHLANKNPQWKGGITNLTGRCLCCEKEIIKQKCGRKEIKYCSNKCQLKYQGGPTNKGVPLSKETKERISRKLTGRKLSEEHIKKCLMRHEKSGLELKFEKIINDLHLPYKFVGNGEVLIGRKCPDFINTNGEKIAIEVFNRKHKEKFRGGFVEWKNNREYIFNSYGYKLLFFDETQITPIEIKNRLTRGVNMTNLNGENINEGRRC